MDEFDDILGKSNNNNYSNSKYNNNWRENQSQEREKAYKTIEQMAIRVATDNTKFKQYLDIQSRFDKYSVGNSLLVLAQEPNAKQFKDKKSWSEKGFSLISNPKSITILEPSKSNTSDRVYYNPKKVYDISQTNAPRENKPINYDDRELLKAFFNNCIATRQAVDKLNNGTIGAEYNKEENILYVCRGMERNLMFQTISQELASIEMRGEEDTTFKSFRAYCISYMLCRKYGIDVSNYNFNKLPDELKLKNDGKSIREELDKMRVACETINSRVVEYFENSAKEKKNKVQER